MTISRQFIVFLFIYRCIEAQLSARCTFDSLQRATRNLRGFFRFHIESEGPEDTIFEATLFTLTQAGEIIGNRTILDNDVFNFRLTDTVVDVGIRDTFNLWTEARVEAPAILVRVTATSGYERDVAYCSPFAATHIDGEQSGLVFVASSAEEQTVTQITAGVTELIPASISVEVGCIDLVRAADANLELGGSFSGSVMIGDSMVLFEDLQYDQAKNKVSVTLLNIPPGSIYIRVAGVATYENNISFLARRADRPLGAMLNEGKVATFGVQIDTPIDGTTFDGQSVTVTGRAAHGNRFQNAFRLNGELFTTTPLIQEPSDGCIGESYVAEFSATVSLEPWIADMIDGDGEIAGLDPGTNYLSILFADFDGYVATDRVRILIGDYQTLSDEPERAERNLVDECANINVPNYIQNGFAFSFSETLFSNAVSRAIVGDVQAKLATDLANGALNPGSEDFEAVDSCPSETPAVIPLTRRLTETSLRKLTWEQQVVLKSGRKLQSLPPVIDPIADQTINEGDLLEIHFTATDPNGDRVDFQVPETDISGGSEFKLEFTDVDGEGTMGWLFSFVAHCGYGGQELEILVAATDSDNTVSTTFNITINEFRGGVVNLPLPVSSYTVNTSALSVDVTLDGGDINAEISTGKISMTISDEICFVPCVAVSSDCCVGIATSTDVTVNDFRVEAIFDAFGLPCGGLTSEDITIETTVDMGTISYSQVPFGKYNFNCKDDPRCNYYLTNFDGGGAARLEQTFSVQRESVIIEDVVRSEILRVVNTNLLPGFSSLGSGFVANTDGTGLTIDTLVSNVPRIASGQALSMGVHTRFNSVLNQERVPVFLNTASSYPDVSATDSDFMVAVSDDALNQMFSEAVASGLARFNELAKVSNAFGDIVPGRLERLPGFDPREAMEFSVDTAQDTAGNTVAPFISFLDDNDTDTDTNVIRVNFIVRGIWLRGASEVSSLDNRSFCNCRVNPTPSCPQECLIFEVGFKLNLITEALVIDTMDGGKALQLSVVDYQDTTRDDGYEAFEIADLTNEAEAMRTSLLESDLLEILIADFNSVIPRFEIPEAALTMDGNVVLSDFDVRSVKVDDTAFGGGDYLVVTANLAT